MANKVSLSNCDLWEVQREFYKTEGIGAWNTVPFHGTSNPSIANDYANVIVSAMQDCQNSSESDKPFYIVELAGGTGALAFYLLKRIQELISILDLQSISYTYVMTDVSEKNIEFWRTHPAFQEFLEQEILDFASFNVGTDESITLRNAGITLSPASTANHTDKPIILIANYLFDTIPHELFRVNGNQLEVGLVNPTITYKPTQFNSNGHLSLNDLGCEVEFQTTKSLFYEEPLLDAILEDYKQNLNDCNILFPIGSLRCIELWANIAQQDLILIATDKGYSTHIETFGKSDVSELNFHGGCFSAMVNFNAIGQYIENKGGQYFHQGAQYLMNTSVFFLGLKLEHLSHTKKALIDHVISSNAGQSNALSNHFISTRFDSSLSTLVAFFESTHWDPALMNQCIDTILSLLKNSSSVELTDLFRGLGKFIDNYYYMPQTGITLINFALIHQEGGYYEKAVEFYTTYLNFFAASDPELFNTANYNIGICHYQMENFDASLTSFRTAANGVGGDDLMARGWVSRIEEELSVSQSV